MLQGGVDGKFVAAFNPSVSDTNTYLSSNGASFAEKGGISNKWATTYINPTEDTWGEQIYETTKTGDMMKEVKLQGVVNYAWFNSYLYLINNREPFINRGNIYYMKSQGSMFTSAGSRGSGYDYGFLFTLTP